MIQEVDVDYLNYERFYTMKRTLALLIPLLFSSAITANEYKCVTIQGQAEARSAILKSPELFAKNSETDSGDIAIGLRYSLSNAKKGKLLLQQSDVYCDIQSIETVLTNLIVNIGDLGKKDALKAEIVYLKRMRSEQNNLVDSMAVGETHTVSDKLKSQKILFQIETRIALAEKSLLMSEDVNVDFNIGDLLSEYRILMLKSQGISHDIIKKSAWDVSPYVGVSHSSSEYDMSAGIQFKYNFGGLRQNSIKSKTISSMSNKSDKLMDATDKMLRKVQKMVDINESELIRLKDNYDNLDSISFNGIDTRKTRLILSDIRVQKILLKADIINLYSTTNTLKSIL